MIEVTTAHTADLDATTLAAAHALFAEVFRGQLNDTDWEHALGGIHALAYDGAVLVAHGSVVQRRLLHGGRALRAGYVEGVAVRESHRRRGYGDAIMAVLERVIRGAYELGALGATDAGALLYARRGWELWRGPTSALTPSGIVRTAEEDGSIHVLRTTAALDLDAAIVADHRDGDAW